MKEFWDVEEGIIDSCVFFEMLIDSFPSATSLYFEGTSISKGAIKLYSKYHQEGNFIPGNSTIFPLSKKYRCKFTSEFIDELSQLTMVSAEPELCDHLHIYEDNNPILIWHDAFANAILISKRVPEAVVSNIASNLGLGYGQATSC